MSGKPMQTMPEELPHFGLAWDWSYAPESGHADPARRPRACAGVRRDSMVFSETERMPEGAGQDPARAVGSVAMAATAMGAMTAAACRRATKPRRVSALLDGDEGWAAGDGVLVS